MNTLIYFKEAVYSSMDENGENIQYFYEDTNKPVPKAEVDRITYIATKELALRKLSSLVDHYYNQISHASPQKLARYEAKYKMAQAYEMGKATGQDIEYLKAEAFERDLSLKEHIKAILTAHASLTNASAQIEIFQAKAKKAIQSAGSIAELESLQKELLGEAKKLLENGVDLTPKEKLEPQKNSSLKPKKKISFLRFRKKPQA